jgi:hypothetical protein
MTHRSVGVSMPATVVTNHSQDPCHIFEAGAPLGKFVELRGVVARIASARAFLKNRSADRTRIFYIGLYDFQRAADTAGRTP